MTGFLNLTEVASKRKTMIPVFWNHGLNLMMLHTHGSFFVCWEVGADNNEVDFL